MFDWKTIAIIAGIPAALGPMIDRFLMKRQKTKLYWLLLKWWDRIGDLRVRHVHRRTALTSIRAFHLIFGRKPCSIRFFLFAFLISASMTFFVTLAGAQLEDSQLGHPIQMLAFVDSIGWFIGVNYVFDAISAYCTIVLLWLVVKSRKSIVGAFFLLLDILIVGALAVACLATYFVITNWAEGREIQAQGQFQYAARILYVALFEDWIDLFTVYLLFPLTVSVPTILYLSFMLVLILSRIVFVIGKRGSELFLERALDDDPEKLIVFTLSGTLFSAIVVISKTLHEIFLRWES